jgi:hypothetical protein
MMNTDETLKRYRNAKRAFYALSEVRFTKDERSREGFSKQLSDARESTMAGLSVLIAHLEAEIGTDNL